MEKSTWALIGPGNVGSELLSRLSGQGQAERIGLYPLPEFIMRSSGITRPDGTLTPFERLEDAEQLPDVAFVAMPSTADGSTAHGYITAFLRQGKVVVTAEKGAAANYFSDLEHASDGFTRLGINATVGGGTRMLEQLSEYNREKGNISQLHLVLNGTMAAIFGAMAPAKGPGLSFEDAVQQAVELGYAEPGSQSPADVLCSEAEGDIPRKVAIVVNKLGLTRTPLELAELKFSLSKREIEQAVDEAPDRRFVVSIYPNSDAERTIDTIGGFDVVREGWRIVGGFQRISTNPLLAKLADMSGPSNGFVVGLGPQESHGVYSLVGPGAGVKPTVDTMISDYLSLRQKNS